MPIAVYHSSSFDYKVSSSIERNPESPILLAPVWPILRSFNCALNLMHIEEWSDWEYSKTSTCWWIKTHLNCDMRLARASEVELSNKVGSMLGHQKHSWDWWCAGLFPGPMESLWKNCRNEKKFFYRICPKRRRSIVSRNITCLSLVTPSPLAEKSSTLTTLLWCVAIWVCSEMGWEKRVWMERVRIESMRNLDGAICVDKR